MVQAGIVSPDTPFIGEQPNKNISLCVYGDSTGLRVWNDKNDPMPIKIANGKTLQECIYYQGGGITVYTDNSVTVKSYDGFYDYYLANERKMSEVMMLPVDGGEVVKDEEYYKKLINGLAVDYNKQVENAPNLYRNSMVLQEVNTPAPIDFACTVFADGRIWTREGYSVGTADRPPCPVNVPTCKLAFKTIATSETYSFIIKGAKKTNGQEFLTAYNASKNGTGEVERVHLEKAPDNFKGNFMISSNTLLLDDTVCQRHDKGITEGFINMVRTISGDAYNTKESFDQLLIYKANLTETELKTELAKDIKLNDGYNDYFNIRRKL